MQQQKLFQGTHQQLSLASVPSLRPVAAAAAKVVPTKIQMSEVVRLRRITVAAAQSEGTIIIDQFGSVLVIGFPMERKRGRT